VRVAINRRYDSTKISHERHGLSEKRCRIINAVLGRDITRVAVRQLRTWKVPLGGESAKRGPPLDNSCGAPSLTFWLARKKIAVKKRFTYFKERRHYVKIYFPRSVHRKNDFAKILKNLTRYRSENNFVWSSK